MSGGGPGLVIWALASGALYALVMAAVVYHDRLFAFVLRPLHARLFPLAHRVARSLRDEPGAWDYDRERARATHRASGLVVVAGYGEANSVRFVTKVGDLKPGVVERRILRDALDRIARAEVGELSANYMAPGPPPERPLLTHEPGAAAGEPGTRR